MDVEAAVASEAETAEFEVNTSSLKPSSGDTKTISQPAALAANALSLTPITTFEVRVDVLGGGCGGCFLCSNEEMLEVPLLLKPLALLFITADNKGTGLFLT